jgi:hypothetical protein
MIRIKIKVKNDHRHLTEDFEAHELLLSPDSEQIRFWVNKIIEDFKDPVDEVTVKTSMEL